MQEWQEWTGLALAGVLAVVAAVLIVLLVRERTRTRRALQAAHAEAASLRGQVEEIERRLAASVAPERPHPQRVDQYLITDLGAEQPEASAPERLDGALFADLVLRETVVKAASLAHGLRRALAPETRHRIRFEVRSQTRAARKQRRRELRDLARRARSGDPAPDAA